MREDEEGRQRPARHFTPAALEGWGVRELEDYIAALRSEIARAEAAIAARQAQRSAADALFRRP
mgnify:CR=1 FL=1